ncbi:Cardiolipin synthase C [Rhodanobacter lindaniclasticus]
MFSHFRRLILPLLLVVTALQGCTLSKAQIRRADAVVAATVDRQQSCHQADHCAQPSPLLQAADQALAASTPAHPVHVVTLLGDSEPALAARVNLIRAARRSIDVQTYIWSQDDVGQLVLDELVRAARRGVQVRILADQLFSFNDPDLLDALARASVNLKVRLYNPTFHKARTPPLDFAAGVLCCFMQFNQRMHNKLMLVDNAIGIAGGRNYQDRYFNWDDTFDYVDRDVMVGGPAADAMAASFELFWRHKRAVPLTHLRDVNRRIVADHVAPPWPAPHYRKPLRVAQLLQAAEDPAWLRAWLVEPSHEVGEVEYFSDLPAKVDDPGGKRTAAFTRHIMQMVSEARHEVLLQTPYLVMSKKAQHIFRTLHRLPDPRRVIVSTNSLASTDAFAVYAMSYKHRKRYLKKFGFEIHEMKPHAPGPAVDYELANFGADTAQVPTATATPANASRTRFHLLGSGRGNHPAPLRSEGRRSGLHAKHRDRRRLRMVGSHNFDPRSDHYNTEPASSSTTMPSPSSCARPSCATPSRRTPGCNAPRQAVVPVLTGVAGHGRFRGSPARLGRVAISLRHRRRSQAGLPAACARAMGARRRSLPSGRRLDRRRPALSELISARCCIDARRSAMSVAKGFLSTSPAANMRGLLLHRWSSTVTPPARRGSRRPPPAPARARSAGGRRRSGWRRRGSCCGSRR